MNRQSYYFEITDMGDIKVEEINSTATKAMEDLDREVAMAILRVQDRFGIVIRQSKFGRTVFE